MSSDNAHAENVLRKALKTLDITHIDAAMIFSGAMCGLYSYVVEMHGSDDLSDVFSENQELRDFFQNYLGYALMIIKECQRIELEERKK